VLAGQRLKVAVERAADSAEHPAETGAAATSESVAEALGVTLDRVADV
jgi:hypothetical protein